MIDISVLPPFVLATVLICIAPGTDLAYMIGVGIAGGRGAALRASAGVAVGVLVYSFVVAAGAGQLVARVPWALTVLQAVGAAYLVWLGIDSLRSARKGVSLNDADTGDHRWFLRGVIVNLTNPKMVLFFLSFLPQFAGDAGSTTAQFITLGLIFMVIGLTVDSLVGVFAGTLQQRLSDSPRAATTLHSVAAAVFFGLAAFVVYEIVAGALAGH
ncbi:Homoserine/homoserine lactone efflux protein [Brevibacterium casei]|nr:MULTISPECIES: LysE family translocator [Brevibacterium]MCM1013164.1 LysE family translocator [Brevibacterium sp. XM4083]VEW10911.1 Homoserine/homoserine lactone efflux protein [Brevibacterium casei]